MGRSCFHRHLSDCSRGVGEYLWSHVLSERDGYVRGESTHPLEKGPPGCGYPSLVEHRVQQDTVSKQAVHILLECILVVIVKWRNIKDTKPIIVVKLSIGSLPSSKNV